MAYTRKFIILKKEFSQTTSDLKGHGKIEARGNRGLASVSIENAERESVYNVLLLSKDNGNFKLGKIFTDEWGRGKEEYNFLQRELENERFSLNDISALVVVKDNKVLLGGYIDKDDKSIENYMDTLSGSIEEDDTETDDERNYEENTYKEEICEKETCEEEINKESTYQEETQEEKIHEEDTYEEKPIDPEEKLESPEEIEDEVPERNPEKIYKGTPKAILEEVKKEIPKQVIDLNHIKRLNQKNQTTMYILSILRFFPYIDPFKYDLEGFNWWIVELDKENEYKSFLPYFSYITGGNNKDKCNNGINPNKLINKYNHYLFGLYNESDEVKYYVYAIPGSFTKEEHPNNGQRGFNTWYEGKNTVGYWILYIDPMTGKQVYPQVPMVPMK